MTAETGSFRRFTGEPNRRQDLESLGLVRQGHHFDRTAIIIIAGQQREIRVSPITVTSVGGDQVTIFKPLKRDFRQAMRELIGDTSLRPLMPRVKP